MLAVDSYTMVPRSGKLRTQKLKSHLVRTQSLNVLPLKPGVGQYIAIHATLTARDFFLAYFYPSGPFTCIFSKPLPISPVLAVANTWFLCPQNKIGHLAGCRFPCWVSGEYKLAKNKQQQKNMTCGIMTCEMNNLEIESEFCVLPWCNLLWLPGLKAQTK